MYNHYVVVSISIDFFNLVIEIDNYLLWNFIKIKTNKTCRKISLLCIHINFYQKTEKFTKIHVFKKIFDYKKKRDLNLAFLTYYLIF